MLPGEVVIVIGDLSRYRIETTDLSERNINKVKMGQRVNVYIEALNDEFAGKVDVARTSTRWVKCGLQSDHDFDSLKVCCGA